MLGRKPIFQRLDNETSTALETFARTNSISIQYCAPHQHRALKAERAIRTFKNHFIATLCTVAEDFPLGLWDELLPQAELCLNHLLPYPSNTIISAYAGLHGGPFDFERTQLHQRAQRLSYMTNLILEHHGLLMDHMDTISVLHKRTIAVIECGQPQHEVFESPIPSRGFFKAYNSLVHQRTIYYVLPSPI